MSTKPFSAPDEAGLKQESALMAPDQTTGCDHVGHHHQLILPPLFAGRVWLKCANISSLAESYQVNSR
jgi:hypothetical protein